MARCILCGRDDALYCQACAELGIEDRDRAWEAADEAKLLLRAIWHGEGPDKWPDAADFHRRVEALVGPPPPGRFNVQTQAPESPDTGRGA